MKLALADLHHFASGLDHWEIVDGAWRAHRLPVAMEEHYLKQDTQKCFLIRMSCTSGVRLRFTSNTRCVRVGFRYGLESRPIYQATLLVDGNQEIPVGPHERRERWEDTVFDPPSAQARLFDLWLPHLCQADVLSLEVDDGCRIELAPPLALRWLAYGDSITQGVYATLPTRTVIARCALELNAAVRNVALGSAVLDEWLADTVPSGSYDVISIAYGTNDFHKGVPVEQYQRNTRRLLASLAQRHPRCPILLLTPLTWVGMREPNKTGFTLDQYRESLFPLAAEFPRARLVAGDSLIPDDPQWFADDVHPNDAGFAGYAENLLPHLKTTLGR